NGSLIFTFRGHTERVTCVTFSPDGQRLAIGGDDSTVRIVAASTGDEALTLKGHLNPVHSLAFSPDGHRLESGGWDGLLRIWGARPLPEHHPGGSAAAGLDARGLIGGVIPEKPRRARHPQRVRTYWRPVGFLVTSRKNHRAVAIAWMGQANSPVRRLFST